jgi:hypothetical protein
VTVSEDPQLQQIVAFADEDIRRAVRAMSAEVQASFALSRATLQTLAALSPELGAAAEMALEDEIDAARRHAAPERVLDLIEGVRATLQAIPEQMARMSALEHALVAAADALPADLDVRAEAYGK